MGKPLATGAYYIQRIETLRIKVMAKIRAISRCISKHIHMCNDRAFDTTLAASKTTEVLRITVALTVAN